MRLIDADRLLTRKMKSKYYHLPNGDIAVPIIDIEHAPTVKPERKKGKWIKDETTYPGPFTDNYVCSECGRIGGDWIKGIRQDQMYPFCPFCGANMRGDR